MKRIPLNLIKKYRLLWDKCKTWQEKGLVRDKFYLEDYLEDTLDSAWEKIVVGEEYYPVIVKTLRDKQGNLPVEEIKRFRSRGYNTRELASAFKTSEVKIGEVLKRFGMNNKTKGFLERSGTYEI